MNGPVNVIPGVMIAVVEGEDAKGRPLVRWGSGAEPAQPALTAWMAHKPDWSVQRGLRVFLGFEDGDVSKPIVLGLLDEPKGLKTDGASKLEAHRNEVPRTLRIDAEQELILECGKAKISLRADGRIVILGGYLLSRSTGANKIRGGTVRIN